MDGGGRYLRPLTAGSPGRPAARVAVATYSPSLPSIFLPAFPFRFRRRRAQSVTVPARRRLPRYLGTGLALGFFAAVGVVGTVEGGHWQDFEVAPHHWAAGAVGLGLDRIVVSGIDQLREKDLLAAAGIGPGTSLAFLSAADVRERLERVPLIESASVRKLYPDELVVHIKERGAHAIWQKNGELFIVAADGTPIDLMQDERLADLPMVVGEQANERTQEYLALLDAAGPIKDRIRAGTLVAGRRWTLKMDNGLDVRLPEIEPKKAVARLAKLQHEQKILDKDVIAVDLRMPDRVVLRLTEEAALSRAEALKKKPTRGKGIET